MPSLFQLSPLASGAILVLGAVVAMALLYALRPVAQRLIIRLAYLFYALLRMASRLLRQGGAALWGHSRELVMAQTRQQLALNNTRQFTRISEFVERGLGGYPSLEHRITQQVSRLEEDYQHSTMAPPPSPDWIDTVESVVNLQLKSNHQPLVEKMLEDIRAMAEEQQRESLRHYRQSVGERHNLLKRMLPAWRKLTARIDRQGRQLREITLRARQIDLQMARLEKLEQSEPSLRMRAKLSRLGYFAIATGALVLLVLVAGVNYQLLAAPLAQALADTTTAEMSLGSFSAGLWLGLQLLLGFVILELLQVTRLLPALGQLAPTTRKAGLGISIALLLTLATLGAMLVWNSGLWAAADNLGAAERSHAELALLISTCLAFILPLILVLSAIPLEQFIDNLRPLAGYAIGAVLLTGSGVLYLLAIFFRRSGPLLVLLYDLVIIVPLVLERRWQGREKKGTSGELQGSKPFPEPIERITDKRPTPADDSVKVSA